MVKDTRKPKVKKSKLLVYLLIFSLSNFFPRAVYPSGIGFYDFKGDVTIANSTFTNNFVGIQATTTNVASVANIWIGGNLINDSERHGIKIDLSNSGAITIENNVLDNSNVPSTAPYTKNGRFGIRVQNHLSPSIANNTIRNFGRSGIQLQSVSNITVVNNVLFSNGKQNFSEIYSDAQIRETRYYGSGLQAINSTFANVADNIISSNHFSGIGDNLSVGTIGPNNIIRYNGDPNLGSQSGGGLTDCVLMPGSGGAMRGGVLAWDLPSDNDELSICNNNMYNNYNLDIAHLGIGLVYSCENQVVPFFASAEDAIFYFDDSSGQVDLDCSDYDTWSLTNNTVDAAGKPFGIIIVGAGSDVTVRNCTIQNAAMNEASRGTTGNGTIVGAGIFVANDATPSISNNYIFSNGWALLDDRIYSEAGSSGIQLRCAEANMSIVNNIIASNKNDGIVGRETGGLIGVVNLGNTFRNNGRGGIGLYDGTTRNLEIAYNVIHDNQRGIGANNFEGDMFTIKNNLIYSNQGNLPVAGIGFTLGNATVSIIGNSIRNNTSSNTTQGAAGVGVTDMVLSNDWTIADNYIFSNTRGYIGGIGFQNLSGTASVSIINNIIVSNGWAESGDGAMAGGIGNIGAADTLTWVVDGNTINNNTGFKSGAFGTKDGAGEVSFTNNTVQNNRVYADVESSFNYMGPGVGLTDSTTSLYVYNSYFSGNTSFSGAAGYIGGAVGIYWDMDYKTTTNGRISYFSVVSNKINYNGSGAISISGAPMGNSGPRFSLANGVLISNNIFSHASVSLLGLEGVYSASTGELTPLVISGNTFYNASTGSGMGGPSALSLDLIKTFNNVLRDNLIEDTIGSCNATGMFCTSCSSGLGMNNNSGVGYLSIFNNTIRNLCSSGIQMRPMGGVSGSFNGENRIYSNYFYNNGHADLSFSGEIYGKGIGISGNAYNGFISIYNNTIDSNEKGGIGFSQTDSAVVWANTVRNNSRGGIGFSSTGNATDEIIIIGNEIYENINLATNGAGGIGFFENLGGIVSIANNNVYSNTGAVGGVGLTASNGSFTFVNNEIMNNIGSGVDSSVENVGGIGFNTISDTNSNVYMAGNTLENNQSMVTGGSERARAGAIGISNANATISIVNNNTIANNHGLCIGGIGFDSLGPDGVVVIDSNVIYSNTGNKSSLGAGGLAFDYASGQITISNNTIYNNINFATGSGGVGLNHLQSTAVVLVDGNSVYSNIGFKIAGIGVLNPTATNVTISQNSLYNNAQSGLGIWDGSFFNIQDNFILSNGLDEQSQGDEFYGSGLQLRDSTFTNGNISGNTIRNNPFAGISNFGTQGVIGPNNLIKYNGDQASSSGGGSMEDCVITAGGGGNIRGGVLVRDLLAGEEMSVMCTNVVETNYWKNVAKTGSGTVYSCGNAVTSYFASAADAVYYFDGSSGSVDLNCGGSVINAAGKPFGIIIVGSASDVTVQNCTIQNAAMDNASRATATNNGITNYIGAGIFISNDATPSITNNYLFSNGWGLLDERIYTEAGSSGIQMRCAEANTSIINNIFAYNKNDGLVIRESGGLIGVVNRGNTFRNNGRNGIGLNEATTRNLEIAYNFIHNNLNGGVGNIADSRATITNNTIYNHTGVDDYGIGNRGAITIRNDSLGIQSGMGSDQVKLDNSAIGTDDAYNGMILALDSGTAKPSAVRIIDYVGSTQTATIYRDWITAPADSDSYRVMDGSASIIKGNDIYNNYIGVASQEYAHPIVGGATAGDGNDIHDNVDMGVGNMGYSSAVIQGNSIYNQSATDDGGVFCKDYANPTVGGLGAGEGNTIFNNAGGVRIRGNAAPYIVGNDIYNNTTWYAGVGIIENSLPLIKNNSIRNNSGMGIGFGDNSQTGTFSGIAQIEGNDISRNEGVDFNIVCQGHPCLEPPYGMSDGIGGIGGSDMVGATIKIVGNNIFSHTGNTLIYSRSSIGFRYATNSDIIIDGNILPDYETGEQAILAQEFQGGGMTIKNNQIWQVLQFLNNDYVEVSDNPFLTAKTWEYIWMTSGVVNYEHRTDDVAVVRNNTIDGKNIAYDGIAVRSDWSDQIADVLITSNVIFDLTEAGVQLGFYPPIRRVRGSVRNNLIYSAGADAGITVSDAWEMEISGNTVYNQPKRAIRLLVPGGIESSPSLAGSQPHSWVRVIDNLIYSTGGGYAVPPSHTGIAVNFSYGSHLSYGDITINSNRSWGNDGKGIGVGNLVYPQTNLEISNNTIGTEGRGNTMTGIGVGVWTIATNVGTVSINNNTVKNNGTNDLVNDRSGGIGLSDFGGTAYINNNVVFSNTGSVSGAGGIGINDFSGATLYIGTNGGNTIRNNAGTDVGGLGISNSSGTISIANNVLYANNNTVSKRGMGFNSFGGTAWISGNSIKYQSMAIGINEMASAAFTIDDNTIISNDLGISIGSVGLMTGSGGTGEVSISNNEIAYGGFGIQTEQTDYTGSGLVIESNDKNGGIHDNSVGLGIMNFITEIVTGPINIINGNIFSNNEISIETQNFAAGPVSGSISISNNTKIDTSIRFQNYTNPVVITDNAKVGGGNYAATATNISETFIIGFKSNTGNIKISGNDILSDKVVAQNIIAIKDATELITITNNKIHGGSLNGIRMQHMSGNSNVHLFTGNTIYNNGTIVSPPGSEDENNGLSIWGYFSPSIYNNLIYSNANNGLSLNQMRGFVLGVNGQPNTIRNNGNAGVGMFNSFEWLGQIPFIQYNVIHDNAFAGIEGQFDARFTIRNNQIYSNGSGNEGTSTSDPPDAGIRLLSSDAAIMDNTIRNNNGAGMALTGMSSTTYISGNTIGGAENQGNSFGGIDIKSSNGTVNIDDSSGIPNTISYNDRSGISFSLSNNVNIQNNIIVSNGLTDDVDPGNTQDASGIRAKDSTLGLLSGNIIRNNTFAGIALYGTPGTIGPNNIIMYDGDQDLGIAAGGGMENCVIPAGGGGVSRGGILVRNLESSGIVSIDCSNIVSDNWNRDIAQIGPGTVTSCGNTVQPGGGFFADASDAVYYYDESTGPVDLNCGGSIINAAGKPFGIIILDSASDVTVQNCTIINAAMDESSRATTNNGKIIGAGIFISNNATPSISNNYIFSNGWALLDDRIYTEAGASGIQLRCAEANTSIVNNTIASNANDGLVARESGALIGVVSEGNTFRNNGRGGIGLYDGTTRNLEIAYNAIHDNLRGIGAKDFDGTMFTIANNIIYSNQGNSTTGGGVGFNNLSGPVLLENNTMRNNSGPDFGGIGVTLVNSGSSISIINNLIDNNTGYMGGIGAKDSDGTYQITDNTIRNNSSSGAGAGGIGVSASNGTYRIDDNSISYNDSAGIAANYFSGTITIDNNNIFSNNDVGIGFDPISGTAVISIMNSRISYNDATAKGKPGGIGISQPANGVTLLIHNNEIHNNKGDVGWMAGDVGGIGISPGPAGNTIEAIISSNDIAYHSIADTGIAQIGIGIVDMSNITSITIKDNHVHHNYNGVMNLFDLGYMLLEGNTITTNENVGAELSFTDDLHIRDNTIADNGWTKQNCGSHRLSTGLVIYQSTIT